jgi:uncharacterized membrane protein YcaP (DUF421 family)
VLVVIRLMGKREIGQLSTFDFVVSIIVAELAAIPMEEMDKPLLEGIVPILVVVAAEILFSFLALKSQWLRGVIDGKPSYIVVKGEMQISEMRRCRYSIEDLLTQLREKGIADLAYVDYAVLETSGKLSVFLKDHFRPLTPKALEDSRVTAQSSGLPTPVIMDGEVIQRNLQQIGRSKAWLEGELVQQGHPEPKHIFFASIDFQGKLTVWHTK